MLMNIIMSSLVSSGFTILLGSYIGTIGAVFTTQCSMGWCLILSLMSLYEVGFKRCPVYFKLTTWVHSGLLNVDWGFLFDSLTACMIFVVVYVSFMVHLYSGEYMATDPHLVRFLSLLSIFTFFMIILITSDNFLQMFVGWEGVGLCSYLLISFWFTRVQANKAAIKAMVLNRIGDFSLLICILLIYVNYKALDYSTVASLTPCFRSHITSFLNSSVDILSLLAWLMFIGSTGKSAQVVLHTWLPDAMEGPTPVSALIHAATMVTAGVFLIIRCSFVYEQIKFFLYYISIVGVATSFLAATTGLFQTDLKRVVAYSTCSQLGYMILSCGLSNYAVGFFHLINHAFFKALLFLSAGAIIHAVNDEQDMRKMGGLRRLVPFTYSMVVIGSLALTGFPFLAGFYSKDLILESAFSEYNTWGCLSYFLGTCVAFLTSFYSMRLCYFTFLSAPLGSKNVICFAFDPGFWMCFVLACLAVPSMFIGYLGRDLFVGPGSDFFGVSICINLTSFNSLDAEFIDTFYKILPTILGLVSVFLGFCFYNFFINFLFEAKQSFIGKKIYYFLNRKWFFDKIYNEYISQFFFKFSYLISYKFIDRGIFEIIGPTGVVIAFTRIGLSIHKTQSGHLSHYILVILMSCGVYFFYDLIEEILPFFLDSRMSCGLFFAGCLVSKVKTYFANIA